MIYWLLQLADLVFYRFLHLFVLFGALCWLIWIVRLTVARGYRPFRGGDGERPAVSILVPVYGEEPDVLERNLATLLGAISERDEVFVIFDERDSDVERPRVHDRRVQVCTAPSGKRPALISGIRRASNPIIVVTASDTRFRPDTVEELVKPFHDETVGGVSGNVKVLDDAGIGAKCYKWSITLRNLMVYPALSRSGSVHVMNGECYGVRRHLALQYLSEFETQRLLGKEYDSGDDGWMTTVLLRHGHRTVFQSTAIALTVAPASFRAFVRQQIRWNRNSTRRTLHAISKPWAYKRGALYPFHLLVTLLRAPLWMLIVVLAIIRLLQGDPVGVISTQWLEPVWSSWRLVFFLVAIIMVRAIRGLPYLRREPKALLFLPLYAIIAPFFLAPVKIYAMLTLRNARWITRGGQHAAHHRRPIPAGLVILGVVFAVLAPVGGLAIALLDDELGAY